MTHRRHRSGPSWDWIKVKIPDSPAKWSSIGKDDGEALPMLRTVGIRMARPFARLAIGLQAVIEPVQQFADHGAADLVAHVAQALAELAQSLARP